MYDSEDIDLNGSNNTNNNNNNNNSHNMEEPFVASLNPINNNTNQPLFSSLFPINNTDNNNNNNINNNNNNDISLILPALSNLPKFDLNDNNLLYELSNNTNTNINNNNNKNVKDKSENEEEDNTDDDVMAKQYDVNGDPIINPITTPHPRQPVLALTDLPPQQYDKHDNKNKETNIQNKLQQRKEQQLQGLQKSNQQLRQYLGNKDYSALQQITPIINTKTRTYTVNNNTTNDELNLIASQITEDNLHFNNEDDITPEQKQIIENHQNKKRKELNMNIIDNNNNNNNHNNNNNDNNDNNNNNDNNTEITGIFDNKKFMVSGRGKHGKIKKHIKDNKGIIVENITEKPDYVIALGNNPDLELTKIREAFNKKICVIKDKWIIECINKKQMIQYTKYKLSKKKKKKKKKHKKNKNNTNNDDDNNKNNNNKKRSRDYTYTTNRKRQRINRGNIKNYCENFQTYDIPENKEEFQKMYGFHYREIWQSYDKNITLSVTDSRDVLIDKINKNLMHKNGYKGMIDDTNDFYHYDNQFEFLEAAIIPSEIIVGASSVNFCRICNKCVAKGGMYCNECGGIEHFLCNDISNPEEWLNKNPDWICIDCQDKKNK